MCLGIPGEVIEIVDPIRQLAKVDVAGVRRNINYGLLEDEGIQPGDWVLIHVGFAMSKISEFDAAEQMRLLRMLGEIDQAMEEVRGYGAEDARNESSGAAGFRIPESWSRPN